MDNFLYQTDNTSDIPNKADYKYFYSEAEKLEKEGTLESLMSAMTHIEMAINNLKDNKNKPTDKSFDIWLEKFTNHQLMIKTSYHKKRINFLLEKVKNEEERKDYRKMVNLYKKIRDSMNFLYNLGSNDIKIENISEIKVKISKLTKMILNEDLSNFQNKKLSEIDQVANSDKYNDIDAEFEEIIFSENGNAYTENNQTEEELNQLEDVQSDMIQLDDNVIENALDTPDKPNKENLLDEIVVISDTSEIEQDDELKNEIMDKKSVQMLLVQMRKTLINNNYQILPTADKDFRDIYGKIDFLAIKIFHIHEFLDICQIIPLKLAKLVGLLLISETKIDYNSYNANIPQNERKGLISTLKIDIKEVIQTLSNDLEKEGLITKNFISYINDDIYLEKNKLTGKGFFYRNHQVQYKFKIQPIIVSYSKVGYLERNIPYAFQQSSDLYVVNINDLNDLLRYIEKKNRSIEKICIKTQPINLFISNKMKLSNALRLIGILVGVFGCFFIISLLFYNKILVSVFQTLQIPFIIGVIVLLGFFLYKYHEKQNEIIQKYNKPFGFDHPDFNSQDLSVALNQINPLEREQFLYEIFNKRSIPKNLTQKIQSVQTYTEFIELFETHLVNIAISNENLNNLKQNFGYYEQKQSYYKALCIFRAIFMLKLRDFIQSHLKKSAENVHDIFILLEIISAECQILFGKNSIRALKQIEKLREGKGQITQNSFNHAIKIINSFIKKIQENVELPSHQDKFKEIYKNVNEDSEEEAAFEKTTTYTEFETPEDRFNEFLREG